MSNLPPEILRMVFEDLHAILAPDGAQKQLALCARVCRKWHSASIPTLYNSIDLWDYDTLWQSHNAAILLSQTLVFHNPSLGAFITRFVAPNMKASVVALQLLSNMPRLRYLDLNIAFLTHLRWTGFQGKSFPELVHLKYRGLALTEQELEDYEPLDGSERWDRYAGLAELGRLSSSKVETLELFQTGYEYTQRDMMGDVELKCLRLVECLLTTDLAEKLEDSCDNLTSLVLVDCDFYDNSHSYFGEGGWWDAEGKVVLHILQAIGSNLTAVELVRSDSGISPKWVSYLPQCQNLTYTTTLPWLRRLQPEDSRNPFSMLNELPASLQRLCVNIEDEPAEIVTLPLLRKLQDDRFLPNFRDIPLIEHCQLPKPRSPSQPYQNIWDARDVALTALVGRGMAIDQAKLQGTLFDTSTYPSND